MSRLTYKSEADGHWYMRDGVWGEGFAKLAQYENIGEPSELRKVTFCPDCHKKDKCDIYKNFGSDDFFCKLGAANDGKNI